MIVTNCMYMQSQLREIKTANGRKKQIKGPSPRKRRSEFLGIERQGEVLLERVVLRLNRAMGDAVVKIHLLQPRRVRLDRHAGLHVNRIFHGLEAKTHLLHTSDGDRLRGIVPCLERLRGVLGLGSAHAKAGVSGRCDF